MAASRSKKCWFRLFTSRQNNYWMKISVSNLSELDGVAEKILNISPHRIFLVYGEMGVGKTTLIKAIGKQLNTIDEVISPTFAIANIYETIDHRSWYHIDLYRLKKPEELMEIGIDEYLNSGNYCFIEWPQLIEPFIEVPAVKITMTLSGKNQRVISVD